MATSIIKSETYTTRKIQYGTSTSFNVGSFVVSFNAELSGFTPIAIISYSFEDRSIGGKVFVTGTRILDNNAEILGNSSTSWSINSLAYVVVLYRRS